MRISLAAVAAALALAACTRQAPTPKAAPPPDAKTQAILDTLPAAYRHPDLDNGEAKFALCRACHTVVEGGANMTGPDLWGVFGRRAGSWRRLRLFRRPQGRWASPGTPTSSTSGSPIPGPWSRTPT